MAGQGDLHFKTNVQLKSIIGKDLINDDNIAILELVKNSFDADAKKVVVKYYNLKENDDHEVEIFSPSTSRLVISDDGVGMDIGDVRDKWLNIAYSEKKSNKTQYNRRMAGAKGVGRFSCDRLGEYLNLYSKKQDSPYYLKLSIDWKKFEVEDENKEIQSIPLKYETLTTAEFVNCGFQPFNKGVLLEIIKLRSPWVYGHADKAGGIQFWNTDKFVDLKKYLEKLFNPNQAFEDNDFGIYLEAPEFENENYARNEHEKFIGKVENRIFDKLDFKSTSIESHTENGGRQIYTELKDKGDTVYWIKEHNPFYPEIRDVKISLYYLNPYAKAFFTKQTGIQSVNYGSVFLFINGFRIPPYGDVGNDWLTLDQRKAQGTRRYLGLRDIVGQIEILDEDNSFQIISSREGIVNNDNFKRLTSSEKNDSYFFKTLRRLERYIVEGLNWDSSIFDSQDKEDAKKLKEIENMIISGAMTEEELLYREDDQTKRFRVYSSIHKLIDAKSSDVIELYVNENLIKDKIDEESRIAEREFEQLITDFENKKIDPDVLTRILQKKAEQNEDLERQLRDFSRYSNNEVTSKALLEIQAFRDRLSDQGRIIQDLQDEIEKSNAKRQQAEDEARAARREAQAIKEELTETRTQNLFLKAIKSQDFDEMVNLMHHIGISTGTIQQYIKGVVFRLENNIEIQNKELKSVFNKLSYELNKIHSISKFATKANFKVETKDTSLDLVSFIEEYLLNIIKPFMPNRIKLIVYEHNVGEFKKTFKPLELIVILDNIIGNSRKILANKENQGSGFEPKIEVSFNKTESEQLQVHFSDNGLGIPAGNLNKIFDYGFTTTDGSGLGLTHVKELVEKIGGTVAAENNLDKGATFILTFNKD